MDFLSTVDHAKSQGQQWHAQLCFHPHDGRIPEVALALQYMRCCRGRITPETRNGSKTSVPVKCPGAPVVFVDEGDATS